MPVQIRAGRLRHRVAWERVSKTADGGGGFTESWVEQDEFWAAILPTTGRERFEGMKLQDEVTHEVIFRGGHAVLPKDRLKFGTRVFNVRYVLDFDERGHKKTALCEEGVPT